MKNSLPVADAAHPARHGEPIANWCKLLKGDTVDIYGVRGSHVSGRVYMVAVDGSIAWIVQDQGRGRSLFLHEDGFQIRRRGDHQMTP